MIFRKGRLRNTAKIRKMIFHCNNVLLRTLICNSKIIQEVSIFTFQIFSDLPSNLIAYYSEFLNTYSANVQILLQAK